MRIRKQKISILMNLCRRDAFWSERAVEPASGRETRGGGGARQGAVRKLKEAKCLPGFELHWLVSRGHHREAAGGGGTAGLGLTRWPGSPPHRLERGVRRSAASSPLKKMSVAERHCAPHLSSSGLCAGQREGFKRRPPRSLLPSSSS